MIGLDEHLLGKGWSVEVMEASLVAFAQEGFDGICDCFTDNDYDYVDEMIYDIKWWCEDKKEEELQLDYIRIISQ